jgi:hypothetical protein
MGIVSLWILVNLPQKTSMNTRFSNPIENGRFFIMLKLLRSSKSHGLFPSFRRRNASRDTKSDVDSLNSQISMKNDSSDVLGMLSFPERDLRVAFRNRFVRHDYVIQETHAKRKAHCIVRLEICYYQGNHVSVRSSC